MPSLAQDALILVLTHALQVLSFTLLITLVLLAIADVNQPFRG